MQLNLRSLSLDDLYQWFPQGSVIETPEGLVKMETFMSGFDVQENYKRSVDDPDAYYAVTTRGDEVVICDIDLVTPFWCEESVLNSDDHKVASFLQRKMQRQWSRTFSHRTYELFRYTTDVDAHFAGIGAMGFRGPDILGWLTDPKLVDYSEAFSRVDGGTWTSCGFQQNLALVRHTHLPKTCLYYKDMLIGVAEESKVGLLPQAWFLAEVVAPYVPELEVLCYD